jgi:hypothetical protein
MFYKHIIWTEVEEFFFVSFELSPRNSFVCATWYYWLYGIDKYDTVMCLSY